MYHSFILKRSVHIGVVVVLFNKYKCSYFSIGILHHMHREMQLSNSHCKIYPNNELWLDFEL